MSTLDEKGLGKRLQEARRAGGFTQQELCHKAGLSYSTLTKIERGAIKAPSIFTIQNIAAALGVTLDELMGGSGGAHQPKQISKSGVRFVYFDLNGCLIRGGSRGFTDLAHQSGQPIDTVETFFWKYDAQVCRGEMSLDELNTRWAQRLGIMVDWKKYYMSAVEAMPDIKELVEWVAKNYRLGIMSNTMPGFITSLRERHLIPNVAYDSIVDSSEAHALKPELQIYEVAVAQAGVKPEEILLIDDDRQNLIAAEQLGWRTVWFDSYQPKVSIENIRSALEPAS